MIKKMEIDGRDVFVFTLSQLIPSVVVPAPAIQDDNPVEEEGLRRLEKLEICFISHVYNTHLNAITNYNDFLLVLFE